MKQLANANTNKEGSCVSQFLSTAEKLLFIPPCTVLNALYQYLLSAVSIGISLVLYCTYMRSFNFRSALLCDVFLFVAPCYT